MTKSSERGPLADHTGDQWKDIVERQRQLETTQQATEMLQQFSEVSDGPSNLMILGLLGLLAGKLRYICLGVAFFLLGTWAYLDSLGFLHWYVHIGPITLPPKDLP